MNRSSIPFRCEDDAAPMTAIPGGGHKSMHYPLIRNGFRVADFLLILCFALFLAGCSGGGSGSGGLDGTGDSAGGGDDPQQAPALQGAPTALASSVISDVYIDSDPDDAEISTDASGNRVIRTEIEIAFLPDATVDEVNALLADISAEVLASLEGFPSLLVRVPDPGSLTALDSLVADIESRGLVAYVLKSTVVELRALPDNIEATLSEGGDPLGSLEIKDFNPQNLGVRAAGAWNFDLLKTQRPTVFVVDGFGFGAPSTRHFDVQTAPGFNALGAEVQTTKKDQHGYEVLGVIAARHSETGRNDLGDFATGIVPGGIALYAFNDFRIRNFSFQKQNTLLMRRLKTAMNASGPNSGTIVVNLSLGPNCTAGQSFSQPCIPYALQNNRVVHFIKLVKHIGAEERVLFVGAAGNKTFLGANVSGGFAAGSADGASSADWLSAMLPNTWTDPVTGASVAPLTNVLNVENARVQDSYPFAPLCVDASSFYGGNIAGVGAINDSSSSTGDFIRLNLLDNAGNVRQEIGTSFAAPQVAGVAALISAVRTDLSAQDIIKLILDTATPFNNKPAAGCETTSTVNMVDAYAALLATDPSNDLAPESALGRLILMDITDSTGQDFSPDGSFNIYDLRKWAEKLTNRSNLTFEEKFYSRYDLNGDGIAAGTGTARFDLDTSISLGNVNSQLGDAPITYNEAAVTDEQIVCYYAHSPLYSLTEGMSPFAADDRDLALESLAPLCEGAVVVTVGPTPITLDPGASQDFTAIVTGTTNTSVTWSATGGAINPTSGRFVAGNTPGTYTVTATSAEESSASDSATVVVRENTGPPADSISGFYPGSGLYTEADAICDPPFPEELALVIEQQGNQVIVDYYDSTDLSFLSTRFSGTYENGVIAATADPSLDFGCGRDDRPCTFDATATLGNDGLVRISGRMLLGGTSGTCSINGVPTLFEGTDSFEFTLTEAPD